MARYVGSVTVNQTTEKRLNFAVEAVDELDAQDKIEQALKVLPNAIPTDSIHRMKVTHSHHYAPESVVFTGLREDKKFA